MSIYILLIALHNCAASIKSLNPSSDLFFGPEVTSRSALPLMSIFKHEELAVLKLRQSRKLEFVQGSIPDDSPSHRSDALIASTPVETRLRLIEASMKQQRNRKHFLGISGPGFGRAYKQYLLRLSFIDACVVRYLVSSLGATRVEANEEYTIYAAEIIEYFQKMYPDGRFRYLTPEYILDCIPLLGNQLYVGDVDVKEDISELLNKNDSPLCGSEKFMLDLRAFEWKIILRARRERIVLTGYDTI